LIAITAFFSVVLRWFCGVVAVFCGAFVVGLAYQRIGIAKDARRFPPPGRLVDIGGIRLHADVIGKLGDSFPPVVFEAGIAATSLSWRLVQNEIAKSTQTISYDRAGLGWSDASLRPRGTWQLVEELRSILDRCSVPTPRVLVAHSFGGLIAAAYALRYPQELKGMVLVDPIGSGEWADAAPLARSMLQRGIFLARCGESLAKLGVVRFALNLLSSGGRTAPKLIARATSGRGGAAFTERMVGQIRKLPPEMWPLIQSHWCDPKCFRAMARQLAALPECAAAVEEEMASTGGQGIAVPFILLSAGDASATQHAAQERLARQSARGRIEIVEDSGHWIQLDRPEVVVNAIRKVIDGEGDAEEVEITDHH
jgi:pimeloyl-ACP methyl ester carboxylesterase